MKDPEFHRLVARANPLGDDVVRQLPTREVEHGLSEEILTMTTPDTAPVRDRRRRTILLAAAAAAVIVALTGILVPRGHPAAPASAYAAEVRAVAEANPRLLLDVPGWKITHVATFTVGEGELTIANGNKGISVHWREARSHDTLLVDRGSGSGNTKQPIEVLGQAGTLFRYGTSTDFTTILPPQGRTFVEIRGDVGSEQGYRDLLAKLRPVDVDTWLAAMPESVVKPLDGERVVTGMLADIPVPDGFDPAPLFKQAVNDRYYVGRIVVAAVSCRWLAQWAEAKKAGDAPRMQQAVSAMRTSRSWQILREMTREGDWPELVWEAADEIAKARTPATYRGSLGC